MATFIGLLSYTDQGIRSVGNTTERFENFKDFSDDMGQSHYEVEWALEHHEVTVKDIYWTQGAYDGVLVMEAKDAETAMTAFLCLDSIGNVRTHTLRAFSKEEMGNILANCSKKNSSQ
jgi:uncharacterized protein with GYD domain